MDKRFSTMIQESAKSSVILIIGQMVSTLVSAIGAILIARILGSTSYGVISIANIPVSISMMLINNGVSNAIINYLVEARQEENEENIFSIILTGYIINVTIGLITTIGLYLLSGYLANQVFNRP
ncbi:MAG: oligosaccharide flippase family protein, partial [Candidatus Hodarchaeales archaeon]